MARDTSDTKSTAEAPTRHPGLKALDKLVGTWRIEGETPGEITYRWMEGGFFLLAQADVKQAGVRQGHIEIIGYDRGAGATKSSDTMTSRLYTTRGDTLDYTHEVDDKTVTSWFGEKGSPSVFKARWSEDGNTLSGEWVWPGGGYKLTLTRVKPTTKR
jgi:hypothetical protein